MDDVLDVTEAPTPIYMTDTSGMTHHQKAVLLVQIERERKKLEQEVEHLKAKAGGIKTELDKAMEDEEFSTSSNIDGANVHLRTEIWAGPVLDPETNKGDHTRLGAALKATDQEWLLPTTIHSQKLSGWVREQIKDVPKIDPETGEVRTLEQRARLSELPDEVVDVLKFTEKRVVAVNGL